MAQWFQLNIRYYVEPFKLLIISNQSIEHGGDQQRKYWKIIEWLGELTQLNFPIEIKINIVDFAIDDCINIFV